MNLTKKIGEKIQRFSPTGPETCRGYPGISRDGEVDPPPLHFEPKRLNRWFNRGFFFDGPMGKNCSFANRWFIASGYLT